MPFKFMSTYPLERWQHTRFMKLFAPTKARTSRRSAGAQEKVVEGDRDLEHDQEHDHRFQPNPALRVEQFGCSSLVKIGT
jgi:hypothetical protein